MDLLIERVSMDEHEDARGLELEIRREEEREMVKLNNMVDKDKK